jgi:hypothetical protein
LREIALRLNTRLGDSNLSTPSPNPLPVGEGLQRYGAHGVKRSRCSAGILYGCSPRLLVRTFAIH